MNPAPTCVSDRAISMARARLHDLAPAPLDPSYREFVSATFEAEV